MDLTLIFSDKPLTPGLRPHIPRMTRSIFTPALLAEYIASITSFSINEFSLIQATAFKPFEAYLLSFVRLSRIVFFKFNGAKLIFSKSPGSIYPET